MVKSISTQTERTRPNSRLQQKSLLETTPILFRLPTVELHPYQSVEDELAPTLLRNFASTLAVSSVGSATTEGSMAPEEDRTEFIQSTPEVAAVARSWWEHWSSGLVMILLVVALILLGIMTLRSLGGTSGGAIAQSGTDNDFGDLDSITIPTTEIAESTSIARIDGAQDVQPSDQQFDSLASDLANVEVTPFQTHSVAEPALAEPALTETALAEPALAEPALAEPALAETALTEQPQWMASLPLPAGALNQSSNQDQPATATLMEPTPGQEPQQEYASVPAVPGLGLPNSMGGSSNAGDPLTQPMSGQLGQSPTLYDGANSGYSMPNLAGARSPISPTTTPVSTLVPKQSTEPTIPSVRATATPESNEEEIIRAYLELTSSNQPTSKTGSENTNRYQRN